ncbi:MAG: hypothetical protein HS104_04145 [Polyangiaceae bacterium]|nr:hypothetical protein [Polyangiaceae bacterium]
MLGGSASARRNDSSGCDCAMREAWLDGAPATDASVVHQAERCSGPADASFYFNYDVLGSAGAAGTSNR